MVAKGLVVIGGLCSACSVFLPWMASEGNRVNGLDRDPLSTAFDFVLGPGPVVVLVCGLITLAFGAAMFARSEPGPVRTLGSFATGASLVVAIVSAYYAIGLAIAPYEVLLPSGSFGVYGPSGMPSPLGGGLLLAVGGGLAGVLGGAMSIGKAKR